MGGDVRNGKEGLLQKVRGRRPSLGECARLHAELLTGVGGGRGRPGRGWFNKLFTLSYFKILLTDFIRFK